MNRKLASIQKIKDIQPIPGADKIEVASVLGWKVVCRKDEFKIGDYAIYCEIDSVLPFQPWTEFLRDKNKLDKPIRLKTVRLRGQLSQGILFPTSILPPSFEILEGQEVAEVLNIVKFEPEIPAQLAGIVEGVFPSHVPKTDELRVQAFPEVITEFKGKEIYISQKMDGTSGTYIFRDGEFKTCSRNLSLKEVVGNAYWDMEKKYDIRNKLQAIYNRTSHNYAIQGEVVGPGIQKNRIGLKEIDLMVFNVYDINEGRYLGYVEFIAFCEENKLKTVPILETGVFTYSTVDDLLEKARGVYPLSNKHQEGIVIRPIIEFRSTVLDGRASFKVINNDFLMDGGN